MDLSSSRFKRIAEPSQATDYLVSDLVPANFNAVQHADAWMGGRAARSLHACRTRSYARNDASPKTPYR
jgi:hypothetical protein